jgi:very-long-chain (3R)-3-hydroxyacyl-CoA dehydratase
MVHIFHRMPSETKPSSGSGGVKNLYLLSYNFVSAALWFTVLLRVAKIGATQGVESGKVYENTERYARLVQTGAVLEVAHSLLGTKPPSLTPLLTYSCYYCN